MITGLLLTLAGGTIQGLFLAPLRFLKSWDWEHIWALWSLIALLFGPLLAGWWFMPEFTITFREAGMWVLLVTLAVGAAAGTSGFLLSLSIPVLGLALANALSSGSGMAAGSMLPLIEQHAESLGMASGWVSIAGIGVAITGMWRCGRAGALRENSAKASPRHGSSLSFVRAILFCTLAGVISSCLNLGLAFQSQLASSARHHGSGDLGISFAFLTPYLVGGCISNFLYAVIVIQRKRSWWKFITPGAARCAAWTVLMGVLFILSVVLYAVGLTYMGAFGTVVGWSVLTAATIVSSAVWDLFQDEWSGRPKQMAREGVLLLLSAIVILALGQYLFEDKSASGAKSSATENTGRPACFDRSSKSKGVVTGS